jgi:hypothetical protein
MSRRVNYVVMTTNLKILLSIGLLVVIYFCDLITLYNSGKANALIFVSSKLCQPTRKKPVQYPYLMIKPKGDLNHIRKTSIKALVICECAEI